ncbi:MAG: DUF547 domain-containing protein [Oligoflexia bacterium]|nr:DUF547 domain-containing protein [Oligoflexia bacterium]
MPMLPALSLALPLLLAGPAQALDAGAWQAVLSARVDQQGRVDYAAIHNDGELEPFLQQLSVATEPAKGPDRIAFWINAYNALTVDLVADNWPLASITALDDGKVWDRRSFTVAGQTVTLNDIEHKHLRPFTDGRIHAALSCASQGCPPLTPTAFSGPDLERQLDTAAARWVSTNAVVIDRTAHAVRFSRIFDWYADDFGDGPSSAPTDPNNKLPQAAAWVAARASPDTAQWLQDRNYSASWNDYSWSVNSQ